MELGVGVNLEAKQSLIILYHTMTRTFVRIPDGVTVEGPVSGYQSGTEAYVYTFYEVEWRPFPEKQTETETEVEDSVYMSVYICV